MSRQSFADLYPMSGLGRLFPFRRSWVFECVFNSRAPETPERTRGGFSVSGDFSSSNRPDEFGSILGGSAVAAR
jgi:hypothetical protein